MRRHVSSLVLVVAGKDGQACMRPQTLDDALDLEADILPKLVDVRWVSTAGEGEVLPDENAELVLRRTKGKQKKSARRASGVGEAAVEKRKRTHASPVEMITFIRSTAPYPHHVLIALHHNLQQSSIPLLRRIRQDAVCGDPVAPSDEERYVVEFEEEGSARFVGERFLYDAKTAETDFLRDRVDDLTGALRDGRGQKGTRRGGEGRTISIRSTSTS